MPIATLDALPGKPLCLQETKEFDNPACTQFVLPQIMGNNACIFSAIAYAVREPGRPPGNYTSFTPSSQHRHDETDSNGKIFVATIPRSNLTMKTDSKAQEPQRYAVQLISRISISFQMILNNLVWSCLTSLNRRKAILQKLFLVFKWDLAHNDQVFHSTNVSIKLFEVQIRTYFTS